MDEEERNKKLRAGKEKLAAFQKKKSKKKHHHHDRAATSGDQTTEIADSSSIDQSSSSDFPLFEDSDQNLASEDEMNTQDSKSLFKTQAKLKQTIERIAELEESLEGKQLALDRVINENAKLKETSYQDKLREMETALVKRDEIIRQLTTKLQTAVNLESDAAQLTQLVQQLQTQLINAGKLMESQNYKQSMSSQALVEAKNEIQALQQCIEDKDQLLNQLSEKVNAISTEYTDLKTSYEMSKQKESESAKVVNSLMSEVEEFRKQGNVNGSVSVSSPNIDVKVQEVRLELEETYGKQIALMKEELSQHYQTETGSLENELKNLKEVCSSLESQQQILEQEKQTLTSDNETYVLSLSELKTNIADVNSKLSELQVEKDKILKQNLMLNEQTVLLKDQLANERLHQKEQVPLITVENVSSSVAKDDIQDNVSSSVSKEEIQDIDVLNENLKLSTELKNLKREHVDVQKQIDDLQKKLKSGRSPKFEVDSQEIVMELRQVTEQYEEALVNIGLMKAKIEDYDIKCENLNDDLSKLNERFRIADVTIKEYEVKIKDYEGKEESLVSKLKEATEKGENAQRQIAEYCDKFVEYEQQLTDYEGLMTQFNELRHECTVYQNQNDDLNNKMNIQQDVVMELKAELEILGNQNQAYQDQALLQTQELGELTNENKSLQESINLYKDQVMKLTNGLTSVSAEMDDYRDKTKSLEIVIEQLEKELEMKGDVELKSKQKDVAIQELEAKIIGLTSVLSEKRPVSEILQKEVALHEACSLEAEIVQKEEHSPCLAYDLNAIENQIMSTSNAQQQFAEKDSSNIDQSDDVLQPVEILQSETSSSGLPVNLVGQQDTFEDQSKDVKIGTDMDVDSLGDDESTRTFDSIEDPSERRNDLVTQISDLQNQNQSLEIDLKKLSEENQDLRLNIENLNTQLHSSSESKSDFEQMVLTCRSEINKLEAEKLEMENCSKSLTESNVTLNEKVKTVESDLVVVMEEKMALQSDLTFVNSIIAEMSHDHEEESQNENPTSEFDELSQANIPKLCNKLQSLKDRFISAQSTVHSLREECDLLKTEKCDIVEIHKNELIQKQEENDNLHNEFNDIKTELDQNEQLKQSLQSEISLVRSENKNLNQTLTETVEKEQNLRVQVDRLSQQIFELSVINQTVNGDKENLENRFVEVSSKENLEEAGLVSSNTNELPQVVSRSESPDLQLTNQNVHVNVVETDSDLNTDDMGGDDVVRQEVKDQDYVPVVSPDESVSSVMVTTPTSPIEALQTCSGDQTTDQSTTVRTTCMPTNLGQVMNVCSSVCVSSVNQLPPNSVSGLVASGAYNDQMITRDNVNCKQDEVLDQKDVNKLQDLSIASDDSNFKSCSESFDQALNNTFDQTKENGVQSVNHDNDPTFKVHSDENDILQDSEDFVEMAVTAENGVQSVNHDNDLTFKARSDENDILQDGEDFVEMAVAAENGDASQYLDQGENENENNERSEHLRNVNTLLKVRLEDTQNDMSEMLNDRVELVGSMENFSDKINSLREHNEQLSQALHKLQEENKSLRRKVSNNKESSEIRCKLEDKIIEIVKENQKLKSDNNESQKMLLEEHESLKSAIQSWKQCSESSLELKGEVTGLFKEMESLSQEKQKLEMLIESMEEAYVVSQSLNEELQRQVLEDAKNLKEMESWRIRAEDIGSQYLESKERFESEVERLKTNLNDVECQKKEIMENLQKETEQSKISTQECESKIQEVETLQGHCLQINLEKEELLKKCKSLECELSELRTSRSELLVKKEQVESQCSQTEKELGSKVDELTEKCTSQEELILEKLKIVEEAKQIQEIWQEKEVNLTTELEELSEKCKNLEQENQDMKEKFITYENQNKDLQETCILYESKITEMNVKCNNLENQMAVIEDSCLQCENQNQALQEKCAGYEMHKQEMNKMNEKSENGLTEMQHQLTETKNQLMETENQLTEMNNQLSEMKIQSTETAYELTETNNQMSDMKNQLTETKNQLTETKNELTETENQLTETNNHMTEANNKLTETENQLSKTENQLTETKNQLAETKEILNQNEKQNLEKCSCYEKQLTEMHDDFVGKNKDMQEKILKLESELEVQHKQSQILEIKEKEIDELEETISSLSLQNKELHNNIRLKENDYEDLEQKYSIMTQDKEDFANKISLLTTDNKEQAKQIEILENKLKEGEVENSAAGETSTQMKERLENKILTLSDENKELVKKCKHLELKKKAVNTKHSELVRTNNVTQEKLQQTVSDFSSENESLSEKCENFQNQVSDLSSENQDLSEKCGNLQSQVSDLTSENEILCGKCDTFQKQVSYLSSENEGFSEKCENLKEHVSELSQNEGLSEKCDNLQTQVSDLTSENKGLSGKSDNLKEQVSDLLSEKDSLSEKYSDIQPKVSELSSENKDLSEKCGNLQEQVSDLLSENERLAEKCNERQQKVSELSSENEKLSKSCQRQEHIIQNLEVGHEDIKQDGQRKLEETVEKFAQENDQLKKSLQDEQIRYNNLAEEMERHKKQSDLINSEFEQLKLSHNAVDMKNKSLMLEIKESHQQCEEMQQSLQKVMEELEQTQKSFMKLHEDHIESKNKKDDLEKENDKMAQQNEKLSQEIEHLSEELASVDEERNELVKSQDLTEQSLRDMQANYESLITLLQQTKGEYENEVSILKAQLNRVSEEVGNLRKCQDILQSDLNNVSSQKLQVISELEQKRKEHEQIYVQNRQLQQELRNKCEKDIHNQGLIDAKQAATNMVLQEPVVNYTDTATQTQSDAESKPEITNAEVQVNLAALHFESDRGKVVGTVDIQSELENDNDRNQQSQHTENSANENSESVEINNAENVDDSQNSDNVGPENNENGENDDDDDEFISEEELEVLIQQKIDLERKQIEYDMEEKYELEFRKRQVELMHTFDKKQKDLEKNFELQVNHRIESLRAEKDQAFVKALQKMKKDFEKRHKKEIEKQRLAHLHEMAVMQDERKGGGHISSVVQTLNQENQELAEARDALLQQVELSHHHQEQLEDELRTVLGENVDGDGKFLCEPHQQNTEQPRHSYRSQSVMLDWEFSPTSSFEHDKDPPGSSKQCLEDICSRPQCFMLRREYLKLKNSKGTSGFQPEMNTDDLSFQPEVNMADFSMAGPGFKPEMEHYEPDDSDGVISTPTSELEASFVKEAMRKAAEVYTDARKTPSCSTPKMNVFIENVASKDDVFLSKDVRKSIMPKHVRSLSLNLPPKTDFFVDLGDNDDKTLDDLLVRHGSLDNFEEPKVTVASGKFLEEFVPEQAMINEAALRSSSCTPQPEEDFLEEITHGLTSSYGSVENNQSPSQPGEHLNMLEDPTDDPLEFPSTVLECFNSDIPSRNSQGEFYEEFISGEMEGFNPNDLNEIALIQSKAPPLQSQVIHDSESEHFAYELSEEEKNDNVKLLKRLESLKNIYCKERQELLSKCQNLTIQLENESLSRVQLEQELTHISEDFSETVSKSRPKKANLTSPLPSDGVDDKVGNSDKILENFKAGSKLEEDNLVCIEKFELMIKNLKQELQEKSEALQRQEVEICAAQILQEQRLNEIKVLYKAELRKLEIENSSLLEQKYQLENQNLQLCKEIESDDIIQDVSICTVSVESQTSDDETHSKLTENQEKQAPEKPERNTQFEQVGAGSEQDKEKVDQEHKKIVGEINILLEKCQKYELDILDKQHVIDELEEKCSSFQTQLNSVVSGNELSDVVDVQNESTCMKELKEKCHHLEIELEYAKQNEAFACVYEDKCKQYEIELENKQECEQELGEMTEKCENLKQENMIMSKEHQTRLNSCSLGIEELQGKCNSLETEVESLHKQLNMSNQKCEQYEKILNLQQETGQVLRQLEDKTKNDEIKFAELQKKCSNLSSRLELQRLKNEEKCKKYEAEIARDEKALHEIHETCSKFENEGYENEHVIQELTSQCQKYQSEIQKLRAKELLQMKKKLTCSMDEIEKTDIYVEEVSESQSKLFAEESAFEQEVIEGEIIQTYVGQVETNQNVTEGHMGLQGRIDELEALLDDKETFISKLESDLEQREDDQARMDDLRQYQEHIEMSLREKDSYIKQLEEHFLQQRNPISVRSPVKPGKYGNVGKPRQDQKSEPVVVSCSTPLPEEKDSIQSEYGSQTDDVNNSFSDHSTISGENEFSNSKSNDSILSDKTDSMNNSTQTLADISRNISMTENSAHSHGSEKDGNLALEMKHFAIVEEISKLRQDLRETKSVYTQENALLKEALDREKWKRNTKLETSFMEAEQQFSSEVVTLQQKVSLLMETNDMLRNENDKWLARVQEQETIVLHLQEQNGHVETSNENNPNQSFNQQLKLLQQQRNELIEKLKDSESKLDTLSQTLGKKSVVEETLRREKAVLQTKLYELEEVEKELTEKKIELQKQKSTQRRLEEMIYHRDLIERELMKQKRLLEVELAEIECKLHEKEELLEIQKNQLLEEIKQNYSSDRGSDTSKLLSSSLEGSDFSFDLSRMTPPPTTSRSYTHTTSPPTLSRSYRHTTPPPMSSRPYTQTSVSTVPKSRSMSQYRQTGNVNRLELMLHDVEREHAEAISYLKEKLQKDSESSDDQAVGGHQSQKSSVYRPYVNKTPHK